MAYPFEPTMLSSPGAGPEGWRHDGFPYIVAGVRAPVPGRGGLRRVAAGAPLGRGLRLPGGRPRPLLAARARGPDPAVPGLPARDLGDRGHGRAPQPPAAEGLVHRRLAGGDAPERDVGPPAVAAARAGQLRVGPAAAAQAAGGDGRPRRGAAGRPGRGGRAQPALPRRGRAGPTRPVARGQAAGRRRGRDRGQGPGADPAGGDRGLLGREPGGFVGADVADGSTVVSGGWPGYRRLKDVEHDPRVVGDAPAHAVLPWVHRVFANAKRWALGVYHGLRPAHLQAYLDEFVSRFNRRHNPAAAFDRLLGLGLTLGPATYQMLVGRN